MVEEIMDSTDKAARRVVKRKFRVRRLGTALFSNVSENRSREVGDFVQKMCSPRMTIFFISQFL